MQIRYRITVLTDQVWVIVLTPRSIVRGRMSESAPRGKSAIKRAAIVRWSRRVACSSGSDAINAVSFRVAVALGRLARQAASSQGSIFCRASAERTLSGISPSLSSPIGANRNASKSDRRDDVEAGSVISKPRRDLNRTCRSDNTVPREVASHHLGTHCKSSPASDRYTDLARWMWCRVDRFRTSVAHVGYM